MAKVIGKGLVGTNFKKTKLGSDFLIYASGVSDSTEVRKMEFEREFKLLSNCLSKYKDKRIIYFSTCSIYQENYTPYILHKLRMEDLIKNKAINYHIYRLPQAVGKVKNSTLISYFIQEILKENKVSIFENASRNLIAIDDIVRIVEDVSISNSNRNYVLNLASSKSVKVLEIFKQIANICGKKVYKYELMPNGAKYDISIYRLKEFLGDDDLILKEDYWKNVLNKYVPKIIELIK